MPANSKVLVIDDERSMRDLLKMGLEEQGYTIRCSADGRGLQETIAEWQPDAGAIRGGAGGWHLSGGHECSRRGR